MVVKQRNCREIDVQKMAMKRKFTFRSTPCKKLYTMKEMKRKTKGGRKRPTSKKSI